MLNCLKTQTFPKKKELFVADYFQLVFVAHLVDDLLIFSKLEAGKLL